MSNREFAKTLIDQIPENRLFYVISYLIRIFMCFLLVYVVYF